MSTSEHDSEHDKAVRGEPKAPSSSSVTLSILMGPNEANLLGNVHGGVIMRLVDEAGALAAVRHARRPVVTVRLDSMTFLEPVYVGNLLTLKATVNWVGRTSMEVGVRVEAENVMSGQRTHTNSAYAVYVALDRTSGQPCAVPPLLLETEEEQRRWEEGAIRRAHRLRQKEEQQQKEQERRAS